MNSQRNRGFEIFGVTILLVGAVFSFILLILFDVQLLLWVIGALLVTSPFVALWFRHTRRSPGRNRGPADVAAAVAFQIIFWGTISLKHVFASYAVDIMLFRPNDFVPNRPPAEVPQWVYEEARLKPIPGDDAFVYSPGVIVLSFSGRASQRDRQHIVDKAGARVIGGTRYGEEGDYFLHIPSAESWDEVAQRSAEFEGDWRVNLVNPLYLHRAGPTTPPIP
jgi:hypothetical protein